MNHCVPRSLLLACCSVLLAGFVPGPAWAAKMLPKLPVESLSGTQLVLPTDLPPGPHLVIVGFTRASRDQTKPWARRAAKAIGSPEGKTVYSVAILDMPHFLQGFVIRGMRKGVPDRLHDTFLLVTDHIDVWKRVAGFTEDNEDAAYLVLLDARHRITWRTHGRFSEKGFRELIMHARAVGWIPQSKRRSNKRDAGSERSKSTISREASVVPCRTSASFGIQHALHCGAELRQLLFRQEIVPNHEPQVQGRR